MHERLQEFTTAGHPKITIERAAATIRGVKILGLESRNGRHYLPAALERAAQLYEGAAVHVNHGPTNEPRQYEDRIGTIRRAAFRPSEGLFGDLHYNAGHPLAEQLVWDAQHATPKVGLSHEVTATVRRENDTAVVEAIETVHSVDLVTQPATTQDLFEHHKPPSNPATPQPPAATTTAERLATMEESLTALRAQLAETCRRAALPQSRDQLPHRPQETTEHWLESITDTP